MSETPKRPTMLVKQTFRLYLKVALKHPKQAWLMLVMPISNVILGVLMPFFASKVLAELLGHSDKVWSYFYLFISSAVVGIALNQIGIKACMTVEALGMDDLHEIVFTRLMERSVGFYSNQVGGKLISESLDFIKGFTDLINNGFVNALGFGLSVLIGLIIIFVNNWIIGTALTSLIIFLGVWSYFETRRRSVIRNERLRYSQAMVSHLSDSIVNAVTVKTFAQEANELKNGRKLSAQLTDVRLRDWGRTVTNESRRMGVLLFAQVVLIFVLIKLTGKNPALLATGIFAFTYTISLINRFFSINTLARQLEDVFLLSTPFTELMAQGVEIEDVKDAALLKVTKGAITLSNVTFGYADANDNSLVFDNLELDVKPGEKVGLVGHSGGGKTTLTRLLLRFDDITSGTIAIDGQDIKQVTQSSLRQNIAYVPQEPLLFHRSVGENIAYSNPKASMDEIKRAAKLANADDFIEKLSDGYDTVVGERGVKLSGGQRQRVAIARAILKDAPILILDEATSALDSESEGLIQDALWKLMEGRTALVIAHRLSTIQKMDRIVVLDDGAIVEQGSHKELLAQKGVYAGLWDRQSGGFIEE